LPRGSCPVAIEAAGPAAARATIAAYTEAGHDVIPIRGPLAMNTVAGAIASWDAALAHLQAAWRSTVLARLLRDAGHYANEGVAVTFSQVLSTTTKFDEVAHQPGFAERFLPNGKILRSALYFANPSSPGFSTTGQGRLGQLLSRRTGRKDRRGFSGPSGALLSIDDLNEYQPRVCQPLAD